MADIRTPPESAKLLGTSRQHRALLAVALAFWLLGGTHELPRAQSEILAVYSDSLLEDCFYESSSEVFITFYVAHAISAGATSARFRIDENFEFHSVYQGESSPYIVVGNTRDGITVSYGACQSNKSLLVAIDYFFAGTPGVCSYIEFLPHPDAVTGDVEITNCSDEVVSAQGFRMYANVSLACSQGLWCQVLPTQKSTWGRVKELYR